jgi:hypothetical protein
MHWKRNLTGSSSTQTTRQSRKKFRRRLLKQSTFVEPELTEDKQRTKPMGDHAAATFTLKSWDEKPYDETVGLAKLSRVSATKSYEGDIAGEGRVEYLMMYRRDGSATFIGLERVVGSVGGRSGSFVFQHSGTFENGIAKVEVSVVSGSGTEGLDGLQGEGEFAVGHKPPYNMTLDYDVN